MREEPGRELKVSTCHTCCLSFKTGAFKPSILCCGAWTLFLLASQWLHCRPCTWSHYVYGHPKDPGCRKQKSPSTQSKGHLFLPLHSFRVWASGCLGRFKGLGLFSPQHCRCWLWRKTARSSSPGLMPTVLPETRHIWTPPPPTAIQRLSCIVSASTLGILNTFLLLLKTALRDIYYSWFGNEGSSEPPFLKRYDLLEVNSIYWHG